MNRRWLWLGAIALSATILFTLVAAPSTGKLNNSGSTYSRSPDGYGAWYAFMEKQGTPVKRWQKPFDNLPGVSSPSVSPTEAQTKTQNGITLLRVNSQLAEGWLNSQEENWVKGGNTLVVLGVRESVTEAKFNTIQESSAGGVRIGTRRRMSELQEGEKQSLGDRFGAVVWQEQLGKGQAIFATTPHLAANAYQDEPGNYKFLAQLVTQTGSLVWVDEYIHGYKDQEVRAKEDAEDWIVYLAKTPLLPAILQAGVLLLVLVLAQNRRLGPPLTLAAPVVDNSEAYIQALAGVLQKAESSEFVLEVVGKEEQLQLQKALGLGSALLDHQTLVAAWVQQTGRKAAELEQVLQLQSKQRRISERDLLAWLEKWQALRYHLPS
ncbi:MAG: DUF4350 domain-containing protein [Aphanothece sp. CMT-3BRIN-NPC111]|jgi:hypothetical protein|nr:DUF4350 domain-containing protein [Aphanothece sp. CMT-3BRIN-NPC111]